MNLFDYINKNKDITFLDKPYTEIDLLIFSQLSYIMFEDFKDKDIKISAISKYLDKSKVKKEYILPQKNAIKILESIEKTKRYKDLLISNYDYIYDKETQFGALTIELPDYMVVSFEGTDNLLSGWKEDAIMSYMYPTNAQKLAAKYLLKTIKKSKKKIITVGHSKGGNLALTGAMILNIFDRRKIKEIYSFDGPGLKRKEFKSLAYKTVRKKLINIIPNQSIVGVLLYQENVEVIKSRYVSVLQHAPWFWQIEEDKLIRTELSEVSKEFKNILDNYLDKVDEEKREVIVQNVFSVLEKAGIDSLTSFTDNALASIRDAIKESKKVDPETQKIITDCATLLLGDVGTTLKEITEEKVQDIKEESIKKVNAIKKKLKK